MEGLRSPAGHTGLRDDAGTGTGPAGGGGFGSDTTITLPNAIAVGVTALELVNSLSVTTPGAEQSQWDVKILASGALAVAGRFAGGPSGGPQFLAAASGLRGQPGLAFIGNPNCGLYAEGAGGNQITSIIVNGARMAAAEYAFGFTVYGGNPLYIKEDHLRGLTIGGAGAGANNLVVFADADVQIGADGALAAAAVAGFLDIPSAAGAFTGVPTQVRAGKTAIGVDTADATGRLYARVGGAWHYAAFTDYTPTATRLPFGGATAGTFTDAAGLNYVTGTGILSAPILSTTEVAASAGTLSIQSLAVAPKVQILLQDATPGLGLFTPHSSMVLDETGGGVSNPGIVQIFGGDIATPRAGTTIIYGLDAAGSALASQTQIIVDGVTARVCVTIPLGGNFLVGAGAGAGSAVYGGQGVLIIEQAATAPTAAPAKDHVVLWVDGGTGSLKARTNTATYTLAL